MSHENRKLGDRYFRFPIASCSGAAREYGNGESGWIDYDIKKMYTMDTTKRNDVAEVTRLGLSDCWLLELLA